MTGKGKIALVTGAGSGLGQAAALALLGEGYSVVLAGRRPDALQETVSLAGANRERALAVPTDVTDPAAVEALFAAIAGRFGRLDLLFNNAGMASPPANFGDVTFEQWRAVVAVNLDGAFLVANHAYRMMRDQTPRGGRIINNGSLSATTPRMGAAPYTASKHAISGLTKSIALDGRQHDIACGQLDIGNAVSPLAAGLATGMPQADGSIRPEPSMAVDNVARAILFMASLPPDANALFVNVMATKMPFVGRG
jgi:NAD(P)-dependent dehydrogenase (short-subunit alcohol dehydrogenase family)